MAGRTDHYDLSTLSVGDSLQLDSYKYSTRDRQTIDRLLYQGAVAHVHDGSTGLLEAPDLGPSLVLDDTQGVIPAGTRVYYKYTYVDVYGNETAASPEAYVETAQPVAAPNAPTLTVTTTGGTLVAGNYYYVLTAYETATTQETLGTNPNWITVGTATTTNTITLTMPSLPSGADGFNIYRKKPGGLAYYWIASTTSTTTYVDTGLDDDCNRVLPTQNTTEMSNAVEITLPGATPTVPEGFTWKIYRTYTAGLYGNSLVTHVVEETTEGSGIITPTYLDLGYGTTVGEPPTTTNTFPSPSKIDLDDGNEVRNQLPPGLVAVFPYQVTLRADDAFVAGRKKDMWVCEFPEFEIVGVRASVTEPPGSTTVLADLHLGASPDFATTIFTTQANRPSVPVSGYIGSVTVPNIVDMVEGQILVLDVDQDGGGATPNQRNLRVTIFGWVRMTSEDSGTPVWE